MAFGKKVASDAREATGDWIRRFQDGETQIRICPMENVNAKGEEVVGTTAWLQEREHFDKNLSIAYPCTQDKDCIGCNSEDKRTQKTQAKVYIIALDEDGEARIFKMGRKLYRSFKAKEQRLMSKASSSNQPLSDRDYIIIRSGAELNTEYEAEAGDVYEVEFPDPADYPSINQALLDEYNEAAAMYGEDGLDVDEDEEDEEDEPAPRKRAAKKSAPAKKAATRKRAEPEPEEDEEDEEEAEEKPASRKRAAKKSAPAKKVVEEPEDEEEVEGLPTEATDEEISNASTAELQDWLEAKGIEFPPRAPRKRLVSIALEAPRY